MNNDNNLKQQICSALAAWIRQRPRMEFRNYGDIKSYRAEVRSISRDKRDAELLLATVRNRDSITGEQLIEASKRAFSGRLSLIIVEDDKTNVVEKVTIDYTTGQYWPTEYRKAAAAVLASALWAYTRDNMPSGPRPHRDASLTSGNGDFTNAGDWLRRHFRKEFGSRLQRRWFN